MSGAIGPAPDSEGSLLGSLQDQLVKAGLAGKGEHEEAEASPVPPVGGQLPPKPKGKKGGKGASLPAEPEQTAQESSGSPEPELVVSEPSTGSEKSPGPQARAQEDSTSSIEDVEILNDGGDAPEKEKEMSMSTQRGKEIGEKILNGVATAAEQEEMLCHLLSFAGQQEMAIAGLPTPILVKVGEEAKSILASSLSDEAKQERVRALLLTITEAVVAASNGGTAVTGIEVIRTGSRRDAAIYSVRMADGTSQLFMGGKKGGGGASDGEFAQLAAQMAGMTVGIGLASWAAGKIAAALGLEAGSLGAILLSTAGIAGGAVAGMYAGKAVYDRFAD